MIRAKIVYEQPLLLPATTTLLGTCPEMYYMSQSAEETRQLMSEGARIASIDEYNRWLADYDATYY